ncbi:MAG: hypothetical protein AAF711_13055 [Planctomycetota bacterium]
MLKRSLGLLSSFVLLVPASETRAQEWVVDTPDDWKQAAQSVEGLAFDQGLVMPADKSARFTSKVQRFDGKRKAKSLTIAQSPIWQNWEPTPNLGPVNMNDAPIFLSIGEGNYWAFGRYGTTGKAKDFVAKPAKLEGFEDTKLVTTPFANQFDAPGGLEPGQGGYHAWQSRDMVNWVHHGPVTNRKAKWSTSAEYVDGKLYIFYDFPNDQDPHVFEDDDLFDGKLGRDLGLAFKDPSDGSDAAFIRDLEGNFRVIYEDWSPIEARKHSWDSPLAGHAVSDDGPKGYEILEPVVDHRTEPTGQTATYTHPHWVKEDPKNFKTNTATYEIHKPAQNAYGDWAAIAIAGQYYLFADFHPASSKKLSTGWFTSDDINKPFAWCDHIGSGHPDPDIGFAKGRFYLWTQQKTDYVSNGPWVESVEARLGVDTDNDGNIDQWTDWQPVKESYSRIEGFAKQVAKTPASLDASKLPAGFGFAFEMKLTDTTENKSKPMIDSVAIEFE